MAGEAATQPVLLARPGLLAGLLPPAVVTRETTLDLQAATRFPSEEAAVATAVEARRREFGTTRICARRALAELGVGDVPIPRGPAGSPVWPAGFVGSLTHCLGFRAAAVARHRDLRSLGIAADPRAGLPADVLDLVADAAERDQLAALHDRDPAVPWDRLLFSAKESVYKAFFPLAGQWLDFTGVALIIDPAGSFVARLLDPQLIRAAGVESFAGRWGVGSEIIVTAVVVLYPDPDPGLAASAT
ncbi:MAG TPA: 4'-phosphopantetheinyl transferase superfamily protein [Microlunatus sp.]